MALKKRSVAKLNNIVFKYLDQLGMTEEAKLEFLSKSNAMIGVESFMSVWFEKMTTQLYQVLQEMGERGLDLNEPVIEDSKVVAAVEDEGRRDTAINMALKKRSVAKLNNIVFKYLDQLGMREEAKREFLSKSNAMIGVESFMSVWFEKMTTQLYQVLHEMGERGIDLNEPVIEDSKVVAAVEDEGRRDTAMPINMALKKRSVAKLNNIVFKYLDQLGMREEAKREFLRKSNAMIGVESFMSVWFEKMTTQLYQVLHEMGERGIDLNEPVIEDSKVVAAVEDEGRRDTAIKRKRRVGSQHSSGPKLPRSTALRIHESEAPPSGSASGMPNPNNVRPFDHKHKNKATLILVSDSDTESD